MLSQERVKPEVVERVLLVASKIIGEKAVRLTLNGSNTSYNDNVNGGVDIVYKLADGIQKIYGEYGGYAIFREIGREVAKELINNYPKDEWNVIMEVAFLQPEGIEPIRHTVCWGGLGFIEGFARKLEPGVVSVKWKERDYENNRCIFEYIRGENGEG